MERIEVDARDTLYRAGTVYAKGMKVLFLLLFLCSSAAVLAR